jgi:tryptophan halogenase
MEQKKSPFYADRDGVIPNNDTQSFTFNFDGVKVGQYLKKLSLPYCNYINGEVTDINFNENGFVKSITLNDGKEIEGDIFIDCTGFSRIFSKRMDKKWISYKNTLPVNSSILYQKKYTDDYEINAETTSIAMKYGWSFQVPTQKRIGCGYVFANDFVNEEQALKEFSDVMGEDIEPFKTIKFETGKIDKIFNKNVLSLGLSGSFIEPAQATAIHVTLSQIRTFVSVFLRDTIENTLNEFNVKTYNKIIDGILNEHKSLIEVNYITNRRDTEFWRYLQDDAPRNEYVQEILDICKYRIPSTIEFEDKFGYAGWGVWCWILAGNNIITPEMATKEIKRLNLRRFQNEYLNHLTNTEKYVSGLMNNNYFVRNILMK